MSASIGFVRFLYLLRRGRKYKMLDVFLEPLLAVIGGLLIWLLCLYWGFPDVIRAVMTSLGAWGGPRTIHLLEKKWLGGTRKTDPLFDNDKDTE